MQLPEGWRVGHTANVSPQWAEQWSQQVKLATSETDVHQLRIILSDRAPWCFPQTIQRFSSELEDRAVELGFRINPVRSSIEAKPWHRRLTDFPDRPKGKLTELSKRMTGEGSEA